MTPAIRHPTASLSCHPQCHPDWEKVFILPQLWLSSGSLSHILASLDSQSRHCCRCWCWPRTLHRTEKPTVPVIFYTKIWHAQRRFLSPKRSSLVLTESPSETHNECKLWVSLSLHYQCDATSYEFSSALHRADCWRLYLSLTGTQNVTMMEPMCD